MAVVRRVVTGTNAEGKAVFVSDGPAPNSHDFEAKPGQAQTRIWFSSGIPSLSPPEEEPTVLGGRVVPDPGGVSFLVVQFAPASAVDDERFDAARLAEELATYAPDLAEAFEDDEAGMHRTSSVDYAVVISGELWLELDDGAETRLRPGDTVVQIAARHGWRNKSDEPAVIAVVLTGADAH